MDFRFLVKEREVRGGLDLAAPHLRSDGKASRHPPKTNFFPLSRSTKMSSTCYVLGAVVKGWKYVRKQNRDH